VVAAETYSKCGVPPRMMTPSATTTSKPAFAQPWAMIGSSNEPAARTSMVSLTPVSLRARSAPATRPSMISVCQLDATTATLAPDPSTVSSGAPCPAMSALLVDVQVGQVVAHARGLGLQVPQVVGRGRDDDRHPLGHLDPVLLQLGRVVGVVRHQADGRDAEVPQDLGARGVVALVLAEAERQVGVDRVLAQVLQLVGAQLVQQADPPALVAAQVDDD